MSRGPQRRDLSDELSAAEQLLDQWNEVDPLISGPSSEVHSVTTKPEVEVQHMPKPLPVTTYRLREDGTWEKTGFREMTPQEREALAHPNTGIDERNRRRGAARREVA